MLKTKFIAKTQIRVLIAVNQHAERLQVERNLNTLGQFHIGTASSFDELNQLTQSPALQFDLLIVDNALTRERGIDAASFCLRNSSIRHALIYGDEHLMLHNRFAAEHWGMLMMAKYADAPTLAWVILTVLGDITGQAELH